MKSVSLVAALLLGALVGFSLGRASAPDAARLSAPAQAAEAPRAPGATAHAALPAPRDDRPPAGARAGTDDDDDASGGVATVATAAPGAAPSARVPALLKDAGVGASCEQQLEVAQANASLLEARRQDLEGDPIPPRDDVAPRFASAGLVRTFDDAFRATKIKGGVETVDCSEFPCIVFGRLSGDEAMVAELEDSKFFAQYDDDVGVMLTWASGDHEREGGPKEGLEREKPPEISLFAFSFYSHDDKRKHGDALDRRIRTRTAEYWNASTPDPHAE